MMEPDMLPIRNIVSNITIRLMCCTKHRTAELFNLCSWNQSTDDSALNELAKQRTTDRYDYSVLCLTRSLNIRWFPQKMDAKNWLKIRIKKFVLSQGVAKAPGPPRIQVPSLAYSMVSIVSLLLALSQGSLRLLARRPRRT
jgi:hypothetical protein